ncbi:NADH:flavin oxidoreductase/NADH oxidase [Vibrio porteresiae]|uniref:NADH:flavin oxidoreductase/NADH oxidase n=1 Tax=Vibrio porteresiae DSM 19223 TaxID=1123496 RepID=A0ABZ0QF34_9VIBR|nr:NADH:flavin oxidoreductase/NADH oxidase [Vibrio porteresiae]WPC75073.1 NADH:flavin oxidoreductase/NADH oxidase [Vibrio porteresiae DSM 19223]
MSALFSPITFGQTTLANRIIVAPMCMYSAENGIVQPWHEQHYATLAQSGAGLLIVEASAVAPEGRISYADAGIWNQECQDAWQQVVSHVSRYSATPMIMQLGHAGRKASTSKPWEGGKPIAADQPNGWQTVAPSESTFAATDPTPNALSLEDIERVINEFVAGALRAQAAGFQGIEIHAAHGYLLHQFLSPISNQREDEFGGSLENRMRLVLQVFEAIKAAVPSSFMVGIRISATDWVEGGWDTEQSIALAKILDTKGCHYIHVSSSGLSAQQQLKVGPNYQVPFAEQIKAQVTMPVIAVGLITDPHQAEEIVQQGQADAIGLARGLLYNPRWPWHAAAELGDTIAVSPQYLRCQPHGLASLFKSA